MRFSRLSKDPADSEGLELLQQAIELAHQHGFELERRDADRLVEQ